MKCYESAAIGVFIGAILLCLIAFLFPKDFSCEVSVGDSKHTVVRYGVMKS